MSGANNTNTPPKYKILEGVHVDKPGGPPLNLKEQMSLRYWRQDPNAGYTYKVIASSNPTPGLKSIENPHVASGLQDIHAGTWNKVHVSVTEGVGVHAYHHPGTGTVVSYKLTSAAQQAAKGSAPGGGLGGGGVGGGGVGGGGVGWRAYSALTGAVRVYELADLAVSAYTFGAAAAAGDYRTCAREAGAVAGGWAGAEAGGWAGAAIGGAIGGPPGALVGGLVGGVLGGFGGGYLGGEAGGATFDACMDGAGLGPGGPDGDGGGDIGGVAVRGVRAIPGLGDSAEFLTSRQHHVGVPVRSPTRIPLLGTVGLVGGAQTLASRIFGEIYWGTVVEHAELMFSLHFNNEKTLYPVLHPYYRTTLVGRVLGLLDYFLKGFINGGVYPPEFLLSWHKLRNCDREYLKAHVVDIRHHLRSNRLHLDYHSLDELLDDQAEDQTGTPKEQEYFSAFRILGVMDNLNVDGDCLVPHPTFDVEHDLNPSASTKAKLSQSINADAHTAHKKRSDTYQCMHELIKELMPQVPMFTENQLRNAGTDINSALDEEYAKGLSGASAGMPCLLLRYILFPLLVKNIITRNLEVFSFKS
ncbi:Phosphocholine transferase AnkX [Pelomyxa schiedti]|nr:Phosphocholine transferase AnkX [Pelomyxa schiedti]